MSLGGEAKSEMAANSALYENRRKRMSKVVTGKVRFSFCHVFQPNENGKYSVTLLIPKSDEKTVKRIRQAMRETAEANAHIWGGKAPKKLEPPVTTMHDGDGVRPTGEDFGPECAGHYVMTVSSKERPGVVDQDLNDIFDASEFYSGCYGRASINCYAYNTEGNKGISFGLNNLQKLADGERLGGGRASAEDDFGDDWDDENEEF